MKHSEHAQPVPAFLSFDVEPDAFQIASTDVDPWPGYGATFGFAGSLRAALAGISGATPRFGWYYRMDPQIEEVCGRPDAAMSTFPERIDALHAAGDHFGVHAHPLRRSDTHGRWVHDFGDAAWLRRCTQHSLDAFAAFTGAPARRYRAGAGFLSNDIIDVLDRNGVDLELSLEPVSGWGLRCGVVTTSIDDSPLHGPYTDCVEAPRTPYHPSVHDFRRHGNGDARRLLIIPMSTARDAESWTLLNRIKRLFLAPDEPVRMLYPSEPWPSERFFWDLLEQELATMERPYVSLAIRTERENSLRGSRVVRLFEALLEHPLAKRLRFVDPLEVASELIAGSAALRRWSLPQTSEAGKTLAPGD